MQDIVDEYAPQKNSRIRLESRLAKPTDLIKAANCFNIIRSELHYFNLFWPQLVLKENRGSANIFQWSTKYQNTVKGTSTKRLFVSREHQEKLKDEFEHIKI